MATIIKREGKKGVSYKIQVAIKDIGSGKTVTKSTTWKPDAGMTLKEIESACIIFADAFEKSVRDSFRTAEEDKGNVNITFAELSQKWLKRSERTYGEGYIANAKEGLGKVLPLIGGYKVKDINASIVQSVYDAIDKMRKQIYIIYPKPNLRKILEHQGKDFIWLRHNSELNCATLSRIYNGQNIGIKYATMFADVVGLDKNRLFNIEIKEEPYASATVKRFKLVIYNVLAYAVRLCLIRDNYASGRYVDLGKRIPHEINCMEEDEIQKFYSTLMKIEHIEWRVSVLTVLLTGMRRGELCGLNWEDIDFEKKRIYIQRSYTECPGVGMKLKDPKTTKSKRIITCPDLLIEQLKEYKEWMEEFKDGVGDKWVDSGSVFIQRTGERIHPANIKMWVSKTCKLAGIPHFSVHSLRHTNITIQIMAGVPIVTVSGRAGHSRTSTTTDTYAYWIKSSDQAAAETLDNLFNTKIGSD